MDQPIFVNDAVNAQFVSDVVDKMVPADISRVLVIYTGGTIGMMNNPQHGYIPVKGFLSKTLAGMSRFHDRTVGNSILSSNLTSDSWHAFNAVNLPVQTTSNDSVKSTETKEDLIVINGVRMQVAQIPALVTPPSLYGKRIKYSILEYDPLLDSCNITMADWVKIATDIEVNYKLFDAFVILHGTDTMAYTASALSFMMEDVGKTIIITGSQVPLAELRNDAVDNLLGALTIAGHFVIPEVGLFFDNKLFRGNRASKVNALEFNAFDSPNLRPLVTVGINIDVSWADVWKPRRIARFRSHKRMNPSVATLRLFPGITEATVRAFLSPPIEGVVLETYGSGNAPSNRPELLRALKEACDRGVVIVNCSQCKRGLVTDVYETGKALLNIGVVAGSDMTPECALTKLSYLLGRYKDPEKCRTLMKRNLRGELTVAAPRQRFTYLPSFPTNGTHNTLVHSVLSLFGVPSASSESPYQAPIGRHLSPSMAELTLGTDDEEIRDDETTIGLERALIPMLLCHAAVSGDVNGLALVLQQYESMVNMPDYSGRSPLHIAASVGQYGTTQILLMHGGNVHIRDRLGCSPLLDACRGGHAEVCRLLRKAGAHFSSEEESEVVSLMCKYASAGDEAKFKLMVECGADLNKSAQDRRAPLHLAVAEGHISIVQIIVDAAIEVQNSRNGQDVEPSKSVDSTSPTSSFQSGFPSIPIPLTRSMSRGTLLQTGKVDLLSFDRWGNTAISEARNAGRLDIVGLLEDAIEKLKR